MLYDVFLSKPYRKNVAKLADSDVAKVREVVQKLANDEPLEPKHKDHKLQGNFAGFRECHIRPNLLLIYKKNKKELILYLLNIGSHSEVF